MSRDQRGKASHEEGERKLVTTPISRRRRGEQWASGRRGARTVLARRLSSQSSARSRLGGGGCDGRAVGGRRPPARSGLRSRSRRPLLRRAGSAGPPGRTAGRIFLHLVETAGLAARGAGAYAAGAAHMTAAGAVSALCATGHGPPACASASLGVFVVSGDIRGNGPVPPLRGAAGPRPWASNAFLRRELHGLSLHHRAGDVPPGDPRVAGQEPRAARPRHRRGRRRHSRRHHRRHGRDGNVRHHHPRGVRRHAAPRRRAPHLRDDHGARDRARRPEHEHPGVHAAHYRLGLHHQPLRQRRAQAGSAAGRGRRQGVRRHQHHRARRRLRPQRHQDDRAVERGEAGLRHERREGLCQRPQGVREVGSPRAATAPSSRPTPRRATRA